MNMNFKELLVMKQKSEVLQQLTETIKKSYDGKYKLISNIEIKIPLKQIEIPNTIKMEPETIDTTIMETKIINTEMSIQTQPKYFDYSVYKKDSPIIFTFGCFQNYTGVVIKNLKYKLVIETKTLNGIEHNETRDFVKEYMRTLGCFLKS